MESDSRLPSWYYDEVAGLMDGEVSAQDIKDFVDTAVCQNILFCGLPKMDQLPSVMRKGVLPIPREGKLSWKEPRHFFGEIEGETLETQDSVFFDTGHTFDPSRRVSAMTIALTTHDRLSQVIGKLSGAMTDSYGVDDVPISALHLFRVSQPNIYSDESTAEIPAMHRSRFGESCTPTITDAYMPALRHIAQGTEQRMFRLLQKVLGDGPLF